MNYFFAVFIILCFSFFYQKSFNREFPETLPISVCTITVLLFVFTLAVPLNVSAIIVSCLGIGGLAYAVSKEYRSIKADGFAIKKYLSCPFILYMILCAVIYITRKGRVAWIWDEFSHWMLSPKNMYTFKNFGIGEYTTTNFPGYPPATGLFNVFFTIFSNEFREDNIFMGMALLIISLIFVSLKGRKRSLSTILIVFFCSVFAPLVIPVAPIGDIFHSLLVDGILGVLFAVILYIYFSSSEFDLFSLLSLTLVSSQLILTKASGAGLFAFAFIIIIADLLFFRMKNIKIVLERRRVYLFSGILLTVPLLINRLWGIYINSHGISEAWDTSQITFEGLWELFINHTPDYRMITLDNFINKFFEVRPFLTVNLYFSYFTIPIFLSVFVLYMGMASGEWKRYVCLNSLICVSYYVYSVSLLVLYLFTYLEYEALILSGFDRYMSTIVLGIVLFIIFMLICPKVHTEKLETTLNHHEAYIKYRYIIVLVFVLCNTGWYVKDNCINYKSKVAETQAMRAGYTIPDEYLKLLDYKTDRVYFICQESIGLDYYIARYDFTPVSLNPKLTWALANDPAANDTWVKNLQNDPAAVDIWTKKSTAAEWEQDLINGGYTYVYIDNYNELFKSEFGRLFRNPDELANDVLYQVILINNGSSVELVPVTLENVESDMLRSVDKASSVRRGV